MSQRAMPMQPAHAVIRGGTESDAGELAVDRVNNVHRPIR
jgi:hypothetical protein